MTLLFEPLRSAGAALDVLAGGSLSLQQLQALQDKRLAQLLEVAVENSPLYRERLMGLKGLKVTSWQKGQKGLKGPRSGLYCLQDIPRICRSELMARFDDWVCDPLIKLHDLQTFTADPARIAAPYLGRYLVWESSGSSHQPGIFVQDQASLAVYDALEALRMNPPDPVRRWLDPWWMTERIAFVGATTGHFASVVSMLRLRQNHPFMQQGLRCFSILQPIGDLVEALNVFRPTIIASYPTVAALLADAAASGQLVISPREVWTGGETLSPAVRKRVAQLLGCRVRNSYGASEFLAMGWECGLGHMHLNSDWVILEPVDSMGKATPPGQLSATTLLTNLANRVQPIIRYDLGDRIRVSTQNCGCGSALPVIEVLGRQDDPLVMAGREGGSVTLLPLALATVLEEEAGVFDFQLRQRDQHTLVLRLGSRGVEATHALSRCRDALARFARSQALAPIQLVPELGQAVPRGRSGKAQRIVACASHALQGIARS